MSRQLKYISRIKDEFDTVICGVNGVITRGTKVDVENLATLIKIYQNGKKIMLASNSGMRVYGLFHFLKNAGVPMNIFNAMITAGEIAHFSLKNNIVSGKKYYAISADATQLMLGLPYEKAENIDTADFILATADSNGIDLDACQSIWEIALRKKLPLICVGNNISLVTDKSVCSGVGTIAEQYAMQGGTIIPFGKPNIQIATYLCENIKNFKTSRCLVIGDDMATDIRMGNSFKAQTLLLTNGCHQITKPTIEQINKLSVEYGLNIDYYTEQLQW